MVLKRVQQLGMDSPNWESPHTKISNFKFEISNCAYGAAWSGATSNTVKTTRESIIIKPAGMNFLLLK